MSDYELLSTVYMVISLVLVAIELGRNLGNQNKKQKVKPPSIAIGWRQVPHTIVEGRSRTKASSLPAISIS